jgi:hypothetical protein
MEKAVDRRNIFHCCKRSSDGLALSLISATVKEMVYLILIGGIRDGRFIVERAKSIGVNGSIMNHLRAKRSPDLAKSVKSR